MSGDRRYRRRSRSSSPSSVERRGADSDRESYGVEAETSGSSSCDRGYLLRDLDHATGAEMERTTVEREDDLETGEADGLMLDFRMERPWVVDRSRTDLDAPVASCEHKVRMVFRELERDARVSEERRSQEFGALLH